MAVITPKIDQFASATAQTSFVELMEMHNRISGKFQSCKQHHERNVALSDELNGNHHLTHAYRLS